MESKHSSVEEGLYEIEDCCINVICLLQQDNLLINCIKIWRYFCAIIKMRILIIRKKWGGKNHEYIERVL